MTTRRRANPANIKVWKDASGPGWSQASAEASTVGLYVVTVYTAYCQGLFWLARSMDNWWTTQPGRPLTEIREEIERITLARASE